MAVSYFHVFDVCVYLAKTGERARSLLKITLASFLTNTCRLGAHKPNSHHSLTQFIFWFWFNAINLDFKEPTFCLWKTDIFGILAVKMCLRLKEYQNWFKYGLILFALLQIVVFCLVESVTNKVAHDIVIGSFYSPF